MKYLRIIITVVITIVATCFLSCKNVHAADDFSRLQWSTFFGASATDWGRYIVTDSANNIYVAGESLGTWGSPIAPYQGNRDVFLAKFSKDGQLVWNTFLGGSDYDFSYGLTIDTAGNLYLTGSSYSAWGSPVIPYNGGIECYVAKFTSTGQPVWNSFIGGTSTDECYDIALDKTGNIFLAGRSNTSWGTSLNPFTNGVEGFLAKMAPSGNLVWHTFMGGATSLDMANSIELDSNNDIIVSGTSYKSWGTPVNPFTLPPSGQRTDVFIVKFNSAGSLIWNTFIGGINNDSVAHMIIDSNNDILIGGISSASWGVPLRAYSSGNDGMIAKISSDGTLKWNTFLGGTGSETILNISKVQNSIWGVATATETWGTPLTPFVSTSGTTDIFIFSVSNDGVFNWNSFFGGTAIDQARSIIIKGNELYGTGLSGATWGNPLNPFTTPGNGFVFAIDIAPPSLRITDLGLIKNIPDKQNLFYYFTSNNPIIKGITAPNATVSFNYGNATITTRSDSTGTFSVKLTDLPSGKNVITYWSEDSYDLNSDTRTLILVIGEENFPDYLRSTPVQVSPSLTPTTAASTVPTPSISPTPYITEQSSIRIQVVDRNDKPIPDAKVELDSKTYTTDAQGFIFLTSEVSNKSNIYTFINGVKTTAALNDHIIKVNNKPVGTISNMCALSILLLLLLLIIIYYMKKLQRITNRNDS